MNNQPSSYAETTGAYPDNAVTAGGSPAVAPEHPHQGHREDPAREALLNVRREVGKAVVGQDPTVTGMLIALLCDGHVLLEGVPGVAKTLMARAVAGDGLPARTCSK